MKTIAATLLLLSIASAHAAPAAIPNPADHMARSCARGPLERVALTSAQCCTGLLACPQLLANTGLVKPRRADRT